MNTIENKETIRHLYAALADGDSKPLMAAMADEACWHMNVFKFRDGKIIEITEYLGTALVERALA